MIKDFIFTKKSKKEFLKLPLEIQKRLNDKKIIWINYEDPLKFAKRIHNNPYGTHRFRIGDYRIIFNIKQDKIEITHIGKRDQIYR